MAASTLGYAARTLRRSPVFAITAAITITLGMGAAVAVFSVARAVLLRPLPYAKPDRLVIACGDMLKRNVKDFPFSNADYLDLQRQARSTFTDFAAVQTFRGTLPGVEGRAPEAIIGAIVSSNFFETMGQPVIAGRDFTERDALPPATVPGVDPLARPVVPLPRIAILSYEFWQRRFGRDASIFGRALPGTAVDGELIPVGVAAPRFELLFPPDANIDVSPDFWICARIPYDVALRNTVQWQVIGRMKDGTSVDRAQAETDAVSEQIRAGDAIKRTAGFHIRLDPMHAHLVAEVRPAILALLGAAIFLLLISCANVANLMLVRTSARARELAVRTALGAGRWQLARQILTEAFLLAIVGGAAGVALASMGIVALRAIAPAGLPRLNAIAINPPVWAFSLLAAIVCAVLFGLASVWMASRRAVIDQLRAGRNAGLMGGTTLRRGAAIAQVALAFVLLIGSGLMLRSFLALQRVNPGFDPENLLTFRIQGGPGARSTAEQRAAFQRDLQTRLAAIPGVVAASAAAPLPLGGGFAPVRWGLEPALADPSKYQAADLQVVSPGYFETVRAPLLAGRAFTPSDNRPDRLVVMIDQMLAAKAFPGQSAIGKRLLTRVVTPQPVWMEVIGVIAHQRENSLLETGREQIFVTDAYVGNFADSWVLRTSGAPAGYAQRVRAAISGVGSNLLATRLEPMDALVDQAKSGTRFSLLLIGALASLASILAGVGLYGVLATVVRQRTAEIGLRMAFGAAPKSIFTLVIGQGMRITIAGMALGLAAALLLTRAMTSMLVGVQPADAVTYGGVAIFFFAIAAVSSWAPAHRAAGLDPTVALRED